MQQEQRLTKRELRRQRQLEKQQARKQAHKVKKKKKYLTWGIGAAVVILIIIAVSLSGGSENGSQTSKNPFFVQIDDQIKGPSPARATLIEYSDFQCPACASFFPMVKQLAEEFPNDLQVVYRHYPLSQIHKNATNAARAAEAAGKQGKFWDMHDALFETQSVWSNERDAQEFFVGLAVDLGLDLEQFERDMDSRGIKDKVNRDRKSGNVLGVSSTPTFVLNGKRIQNPPSFDVFYNLVVTAIESTPELQPLNKPDDENATSTDETATSSPLIDNSIGVDDNDTAICVDLCGDNQCQEVVCLAIGCPCAETPQSCPQDCPVE